MKQKYTREVLISILSLIIAFSAFFSVPKTALASCEGVLEIYYFPNGKGPFTIIGTDTSTITFSPLDEFKLHFKTAGCYSSQGFDHYQVLINDEQQDSGTPEANGTIDLTTPASNADVTYKLNVNHSYNSLNEVHISWHVNFQLDDGSGTGDGALLISNVKVSKIKATSAYVSWDTNITGNTEIVYAEKSAELNAALSHQGSNRCFSEDGSTVCRFENFDLTSHSLTVSGLKASTEYNYVVRSSPDENTASTTDGVYSFTTADSSGGGGQDNGKDNTVPPINNQPTTVIKPPPGKENTVNIAQRQDLFNPIMNDSLIGLAISLIKMFLAGVAALAIVFIVMGAYRLVVSRGNPEMVTRGKDILIWSIAGLMVALMAFSLVAIIQNLLGAI